MLDEDIFVKFRGTDGESHTGEIIKGPNANTENYVVEYKGHNIFVQKDKIVNIGKDVRGQYIGDKLGIFD